MAWKRAERDRGWGGGEVVLISCVPTVLRPFDPHTPTMSRDGTRRVFTDQADIACHQARSAVRCSASRMEGELRPAKNHL